MIALAPTGPVPDLVLGAATGPDPAPRPEPRGTAVLVELDLRTPTWRARAPHRAGAAGLPLDVRFVVEPDGLDVLAGAADALRGIPLVRVGVFDASGAARHVSPSATVDALRAALGAAGVAAPVVGGSRSHFTELNRERHRLPDDLDGLAVTLTPPLPQPRHEQLVESVAMQRLVGGEAVAFAAGMPVHIGPICLRPRFNDVATAPEPAPTRDDLAEGYGAAFTATDDERQTSHRARGLDDLERGPRSAFRGRLDRLVRAVGTARRPLEHGRGVPGRRGDRGAGRARRRHAPRG